jgi:hypothetical protein
MLTLWQDRARLEGGIGWWKQIGDALDAAQFLDASRKEWRYARQEGVHVYPVKGVPDAQIPWASMPRWMIKTRFFDASTVAGGEFQPGLEWDSFSSASPACAGNDEWRISIVEVT